MRITRSDEYEYVRDDSPIAEDFARRMGYSYYNQPQKITSIQEYVNSMINRAGAADYIKMINSMLEPEQTKTADTQTQSLIDIQKIKDAIDDAIDVKGFTDRISILIELQKRVKVDDEIPENLKNVIGDKKLNDYIDSKLNMKELKQSDKVKYDFNAKVPVDEKSSKETQYFNFTSNPDEQK